MSAVWMRVRAEVRSRWRGWLGLALLVGLGGGAATAAAAGARRTDSAYPRFLRATQAPDVAMPIFPWLPIARFDVKKVAEIPQVAAVDVITNYFTSDGPTVGASADPGLIRRLRILEGRRPRLDRVDELVIGFTAAEILGVRVGETLPVRFEEGDEESGQKLRSMDFRVVGISASAGDFPPVEEGVPTWSAAYATPAFHAAFAGKLSHFELITARLRRGAADLPAFEKELQRAVGERGYFIFRERDHAANVQRSIHLQAVALWLLAGLLAVAALLTLGQALARQMFLESVEHPVLRALGMSRTQLWALGMARAGLIAVAGAAVAAGVALLLSPLTPVGLARTAEPASGFAFDGAALGAGTAATVLLVGLLAAWPAWRAARAARALAAVEPSGLQRPSVLANAFARFGFPPTAVAGVRLALEPGRGHTTLPVRTTIAGVTLGIVALAMAFGFGSSLTHLEGTPRLYGVTADTAFFVEEGAASLVGELSSDPRIEALSVGSGGYPIVVGDVPILAMAQDGTVMPPILEGRAPRADREILLGSETLRAVGARVGDRVAVRTQGSGAPPLEMRIVGRAVFPPITVTIGLGKGALVNLGAARALVGEVARGDEAPTFDNELTVRFAPGVDKRAAFEDLRRRLDSDARLEHPLPSDLVNFGRVDDMPIVLAGVLAAFATATLAHALVTSIRRRRRDLAILKTLGFVRGQVRRTVGWQATTIIAVALVVGLPLGVAAARWAWSVFANQIGIVSEPDVWWPPVLSTIPAMLVLANLLAAIPGRVASRLRPAAVLRTE